MEQGSDILSMAQWKPALQGQHLLQEKEQTIPGSVQYTIKRFKKLPQTNIADTGIMVYHFKEDELVAMLQWMKQNAAKGFFINDVLPSVSC